MTDMSGISDTTAGDDRRPASADGSWMAWTAGGIAGIWVAVAAISLLAPDMVTGSEQQHMPVAAFGTWLWGLIATGTYLWGMERLRGRQGSTGVDDASRERPTAIWRR